MTTWARHPARRAGPAPVASRASARPRRVRSALASVLILSIASSGCGGMSVLHRVDPFDHGPKAKASEAEKQAIEAREKSALDPKEPYWDYKLAQTYLAADSVPQAERSLKASLARDPGYAPALSSLSKLYFDQGRHEEAITMLEAARTRPDGSPGELPQVLLVGLALHYDALDRLDKTNALLADAVRLDPKSAHSANVYLTLRGEKPDDAKDLAAAERDEHPKSAVSENNYGITKLRAGDPTSARKAFLKAIELDPKLPGPYYNLAIIDKFYLFDDDQAMTWFKEYRARSKQDPDSLVGVFQKGKSQNLAGEGR